MNIADTGQSANSAPAQQAAAAQSASTAREAVPQPKPVPERTEQVRQDEYVAEQPKAVSNAVYSITDVNRGLISQLNTQLKVGKHTASGEKIDRKIAEMVLPTGRKSLTIYAKTS